MRSLHNFVRSLCVYIKIIQGVQRAQELRGRRSNRTESGRFLRNKDYTGMSWESRHPAMRTYFRAAAPTFAVSRVQGSAQASPHRRYPTAAAAN